MAVDPNPQIYDLISTGEITAINYGTGDAGSFKVDELGIAGTRTSDVIFTRTAGVWVVDAEIGKYVWAYVAGTYDEGAWFPITDNDTTTITITGVLTASCNRIQIAITEEHGTEYHIWNNKGSTGSSKMTSVKITVRDADGSEDDNVTTQHWVEVKSTTIVAGTGSSGSIVGETDDDMPAFQSVGKDNYLSIGDIPSNCYRVIFVRVNIPTSAEQAPVAFSLYVTNQQPSTPITKWITRDKFNAIVPTTGDPFAMSTGGTTGTIPYNGGTALINSNEVYYGSSGSYTITSTGSGNYNIYLNESGVLSGTTGALASNQLSLYAATYSSGICTALTDKRVYLVGFLAGSSGAIPVAPLIKGSMFFDFNNGILSGATSTGWKTLTS